MCAALKEQQQQELKSDDHENRELAHLRDDELAMIAKAHAAKMAQKWEKIHAKEAKRAGKSTPSTGGHSKKSTVKS